MERHVFETTETSVGESLLLPSISVTGIGLEGTQCCGIECRSSFLAGPGPLTFGATSWPILRKPVHRNGVQQWRERAVEQAQLYESEFFRLLPNNLAETERHGFYLFVGV